MTLPSVELQLVSTIGALLCLVAYVGHQLHLIDSRKPLFSFLNMLGAALLGYVALHPFQLGFVIMETAWTLISIYGLVKSFRGVET